MTIVYMGSMDDRVLKYQWKQSKSVLNTYLNSIVQNIIIGNKSAINDGYILNNHLLRDSIFSTESTLLQDLLTTGEVIIPGRMATFNDLIDEQINGGVTTFNEISDNVRDRLSSIDKAITSSNSRIGGPDSMTVWGGFYNLMASLRTRNFNELGFDDKLVGEYDFNLSLDTYLNLQNDTKPSSRTEWEKTLQKLSNSKSNKNGLSFGKFTKRALMNLANEAYHYNFAKLLSDKEKSSIGVETAFTPAFSYMLKNGKCDLDSSETHIPLIEIPKLNNLLHIDSINKLLRSDGVGAARIDFIDALNKINNGIVVQHNIDNLKQAAETYNLWINKEFSRPSTENCVADFVSFGISSCLVPFSNLGFIASWSLQNVGTRCVTQLYTNNRFKKIDYTKNTMVSSSIDNT